MISGKAILALSVCFAAYLCVRWRTGEPSKYLQPKERIISAWQTQIAPPTVGFTRVALGINACVDLIVNGTQLLHALGITPGRLVKHGTLESMVHLQETFHHHFAAGAGGERYFGDSKVFQDVVAVATQQDGGQIQLVAPVGPRLREMLHQDITVPESSRIPQDEVHLIMEYMVGERWGPSTATVATRFITSNDQSNSRVQALEPMFETLKQFQPDLIVLSGLHMLDGQDSHFWWNRLKMLSAKLEEVPNNLPVHLELASIGNTKLAHAVAKEILQRVTSLGLNEQELILTSHLMGGPHKNIYDSKGQPIIHKITDTMVWLLQKYGYSSTNPKSKFTRLHFHTLSYHIIGVVPSVWGNSAVAVAAGTQHAGRQACDTTSLNPEEADLKIPNKFTLFTGDAERTFLHTEPVTSFTHESLEFSFSPVLVCREPLKTVGLGDAISATGLLYSTFLGLH